MGAVGGGGGGAGVGGGGGVGGGARNIVSGKGNVPPSPLG